MLAKLFFYTFLNISVCLFYETGCLAIPRIIVHFKYHVHIVCYKLRICSPLITYKLLMYSFTFYYSISLSKGVYDVFRTRRI